MDSKTIAQKILETGYVCDNCLGRQFAQLLSGFSNDERGRFLRTAIAMDMDAGKKTDAELSNFYRYNFRNEKIKAKKEKCCWVCNGLFTKIDKLAEKTAKEMSCFEFSTFLIGVRLSEKLIENEEILWEKTGIEHCESIKKEISRETGKRVAAILGKDVDLKTPELAVLINMDENYVKITSNPLFIKGKYKKLRRGLSQSRFFCPKCKGIGCKECGWKGKIRKTSVEEIIGKPILKATRGIGTKFHGAGREDIDARCLDWRNFAIEITEPKNRKIDLKKIKAKVNSGKSVNVSGLKLCSVKDVPAIKNETKDKTYRALVELNKKVARKDLKKLDKLKGIIRQRTPARVAYRRADLIRKRKVLSVKYKWIAERQIELTIRAGSGLYVKELVSGDDERTKPSVSGLLGMKAKVKELDVVKIG